MSIKIIGGRAVNIPDDDPNPDQPPPPPRPKFVQDDLAAGLAMQPRRRMPPPEPPLMVPKEFPKPKRPPIEFPTRLMYRLDDLTGEREISERLVRKVALNNPARNGQWCVEKALWDLQRDRY